MKKHLSLLALAALLAATPLSARRLTIEVATPGTLARQIAPDKKYTTTAITLRGTLNGTDLRFLREMAGSNVNQQPTPGRLVDIDLAHVSFDGSGLPYIDKDGPWRPTSRHAVPKFLFRHTRLERVVMPLRTDTIGAGAFEHTRLRRVALPDGVVVEHYAFNANPELEAVDFPAYVSKIWPHAFAQTPRLRRLVMHNVGYVAGQAFDELTGVERITFSGAVGHMDGWYTFNNCPRLERIDFFGPINSTGGTIMFANCPRLSQAVFHDVVCSTGIGQAENCPALSGPTALAPVLQKRAASAWQGGDMPADDDLAAADDAAAGVYRLYAAMHLRRPGFELADHRAYDLLYAAARRCAQSGLADRALDYLQAVVDAQLIGPDMLNPADSAWAPISQLPLFNQLRLELPSDDYLTVLQRSAPYESRPDFSYAAPSDSGLRRVRQFFNVDSLAGSGDELSRIKRLMYWVHDAIRHDGSSSAPRCDFNAVDLYRTCKAQGRGLNCRYLAMMLNELYLAAGFKARFITCQSARYDADPDCHVINVVWSDSLQKWVWMDPTFAAYVSDERGVLLHPGEVRRRLMANLPLILNEDANWNHEQKQTKAHYLESYMAKNLYLLSAWTRYGCQVEGKNRLPGNTNVTLAPQGFAYRWGGLATADEAYFWQPPRP